MLADLHAVVDGNMSGRGKPDPEAFLKAAAPLRVDPGACLVVEDAAVGVGAAPAAGMMVLDVGGAVSLFPASPRPVPRARPG